MKFSALDALSKISGVVRDLGFDALNSLHYWRHNLRGNRVRKNYFSEDSEHHPVVLVQGFMGTRGVLLPLENHLRKAGRDVVSVDLGFFNVSDIRESAEILAYKIERIFDKYAKTHGFKKIDIIGHSMGGLIALYYVKKLGGHRLVDRLICLGTPFSGTWTSWMGMFPLGIVSKGLWQMLPNSKFLRRLQKTADETIDSTIVSLAAKYDAICPPKSCELRDATNEVMNVGHAGLLMSEEVLETIVKHLDSTKRGARPKVVSLSKHRK